MLGCQFTFDNPVDGNGGTGFGNDICICEKGSDSDNSCGSEGSTETVKDSSSNEELFFDSSCTDSVEYATDSDTEFVKCDDGCHLKAIAVYLQSLRTK